MGNYEKILKIEEIRKKVDEGDFLSAQRILDTANIKKIKNISDLGLMAEVYLQNERYDEATELYLKIYDKIKTRKTIFSLVEISIKKGSTEDAERYLAQYQKTSPEDFDGFVFHYKIEKIKGASYEQLIDLLKSLKKIEYTENWAYELAKTYYKAGMEEECIRECSDIILWFGEGIYVEKAKMLRSYYSGESGKEKIMEELRRRTEATEGNTFVLTSESDINPELNSELEMDNNFEEDSNQELHGNPELDNIPELNSELELDSNLKSNINENTLQTAEALEGTEEEVFSSTDFLIGRETEEFEEYLKKDVRDIILNDVDEDESIEDELIEAETIEFEAINEDVEEAVLEFPEEQYESQSEPEVLEDVIYSLPEESMDDDDKKLIAIAEEFQIDPYEIFGSFLHIVSVKKQLLKCLENMLQDSTKSLIMIITGNDGAGKTTLAKCIALFLSKTEMLKSSKVAKITAEKLNTVQIEEKRETLRSCCLVVENASELKRTTIDGLLELTRYFEGDFTIIFEENKKNMNKLFREYPRLMDLLKNRIHLPQYSREDLMGFAYACLRQKDYKYNPKIDPLLQSKINQIAKQSEQHRHLEQIYDLMQSAMNAADIRTGKQLTTLASQGRLKDVEILTVLPEDF